MWMLVLACAARDPVSSGTSDSDSAVTDTGDSAVDSSDSVPKDTAHTGDSGPNETGETGTPPPPLPCGTLVGSTQLSGPGWEVAIPATVTADGGRVLVAFLQGTTATFAEGTPDAITIKAPGTSAVLVRFDASGGIEWWREITSPDSAWVSGVAMLSDGGLAVVGSFETSIDIAAGEPEHIEMEATGTIPYFNSDAYVARFSDDGTLLWARQFTGEGMDAAVSVAVLSDDSIVVGGVQGDDVFASDGESDAVLLKVPPGSTQSGFVVEYDADGALLWTQQLLSAGYGSVNAVAADPATDDIVAVGVYDYEAILGYGEASELTIETDSVGSGIVARYDASGTFLGVAEALHARVYDVGIASDGSIVAAGDFLYDATFGAGEPHETVLTSPGRDAFAARFDSTGALEWVAQTLSGASNTPAMWRALAPDDAGGLVAIGSFQGSVDLGKSSTGDVTLDPRGTSDMMAAHYDATGALVCATQFGGRDAADGTGVLRLADGTFQLGAVFADRATAAAGTPEEALFTADGLGDSVLLDYAF
jgi:hypothetical protein